MDFDFTELKLIKIEMEVEQTKSLEKEKIPKLLFKLSIPSILGMLSVSIYNITDTIFLGQGVGTIAIAALAVALPITMLISTFGQAIGMGGSSIISRALGAKDKDKAELTLHNIVTIIVFLNIILLFIVATNINTFLRIFGANDEILPYARKYLYWTLPGAFFINIFNVLMNIIRTEGNAKFPMIAQIVSALLNIIIDSIFIFVFKWGVMGAALATSISQIVGAMFCLWYFTMNKKSLLKIKFTNLLKLPEKNITKETFAIGASSFARQAAASIMTIVVNNTLINYGGSQSIATFGIIHRLSMFIFMPLFGINQGFMPIAGFNYGAKDFNRVIQAIKVSVISSTLFCLLAMASYSIFSFDLMRIFTKDKSVIEYGGNMLRIFILAFPVVGFQIIGSGLYQSLGKAKASFFLALSRQMLFLIPLVIILPKFLGEIGIWLSFPSSDILSSIVTGIMMISLINSLKRDLHVLKNNPV